MNKPSEYFTLYPCAGRTRTYTFSIDSLTPVSTMTKHELAEAYFSSSSTEGYHAHCALLYTSSALCPMLRTGQNRRERRPTMPSSPEPHSMLYLCSGIPKLSIINFQLSIKTLFLMPITYQIVGCTNPRGAEGVDYATIRAKNPFRQIRNNGGRREHDGAVRDRERAPASGGCWRPLRGRSGD